MKSRGVAPVTDDIPSIQYPYENVREDSSYTAGLSIDPAHAFALLGPQADAATRARRTRCVARNRGRRVGAAAVADQGPGVGGARVRHALQPALHARPANIGLWSLLGLDPDHVRAAEAALSRGSAAQLDAEWTLMRHAFYAGKYADALDRLVKLRPQPDELALHALFRAGCLRALERAGRKCRRISASRGLEP